MKSIGRAKFLKILLLTAVLAFVIFSTQTAFARELENDYPQIPLPGFGNYSLNEVFQAITAEEEKDGGPAYDDFKDRDPLSSLIFYFYVMAVMVVGLIAFGAFIIAGVKLLLSGANPGLRKDAKDQLVAAIIGIVILLGSWIILNTINPELRILHRVGQKMGPVPPVTVFNDLKDEFAADDPTAISLDPGSFRYGGVVLYQDEAMNGEKDGSEIVLNNILNFGQGAWVNHDKLRGVRILGGCSIRLYEADDFNVGEDDVEEWTIGPGPRAVDVVEMEFGLASSLEFVDASCLGNSITLYEDPDFKKGTFPLIYNARDLADDALHKPGFKDAGDDFESLLFASNGGEGTGELVVTLCKHEDFEDCTSDIQKDIPNMDVNTQLPDTSWGDEVSSISLGGTGKNRQAGVLLYNKDDFDGTSEIFIVSDEDISPKAGEKRNMIAMDEFGTEKEWVSSLRILGEYTVTFYDEAKFGGKYLRFYNTEDVVGFEQGVAPQPSPGSMTTLTRQSGVLQISKLSIYPHPDGGSWNDDKIRSIKLEIPRSIYDEQRLGIDGGCPDPDTCMLFP